MKRLTILIILIGLAIIFPSQVKAETDFSTNYDVTYSILDSGETQVSNDITIKNSNNKVYASTYKLTINNIKVYDIEAYQKNSELDIDTEEDGNTTKVTVHFKYQVIGEGNELVFNLSYKTKDIAFKKGRILEVYIPRISGLSSSTLYNLTLEVPDEYGPLMYVSPKPEKEIASKDLRSYSFSKELIKDNPIVAGFGENQIFNFNLKYFLSNSELIPKMMPIAFPSDVPYRQQVLIKELNIKPNKVEIDNDGNYIAYYLVNSKTELNIELKGSAKIMNKFIDVKAGGKFDQIPLELKSNYLSEQKYWNTNDERIKNIAKELKDENLTVSENAYKAYTYVATHLKYKDIKTENIEVIRLGASEALNQPDNAICMEFVDLFIAITRAMGIPSREINGYAYVKDSPLTPLSINIKGGDVLHAWAEFYDPNLSWVQIDPTWGSTSNLDYFTKLDTNHFAFVTKGLDSEYPLPAGAYKNPNDLKPQVDVDFDSSDEAEPSKFKLSSYYSISINPFEILKGKRKIAIINTGNATLFNVEGTKVKKFPPYFKAELYEEVKDNKATIKFQDFDGKEQTIETTFEKVEEGEVSKFNYFPFVQFALVAFGLYMIFYLLVTRVVFRKK